MTKEEVISAIASTVNAFAPGGDPAGLMSIADRESAFKPGAIGDKGIAPGVYEKERAELRAMGNPYADQPELWGGSFGLYQLMAPYWARVWDPKANPQILFSPWVATVTAMRIWNKAVKAGAKNIVQVRLYWGYGPKGIKNYPEGTKQYDERMASEKKRFAKLGYSPAYAMKPASSFGYGPAGTGPSVKQAAVVKSIMNGETTPATDTTDGPSALGLLLGLFCAGGVVWIAKRKG